MTPRARAKNVERGQHQVHLDLGGQAPERDLHQRAAGQVLDEEQVHEQGAGVLGDGEAGLRRVRVGERHQHEVDDQNGRHAEGVDAEGPADQEAGVEPRARGRPSRLLAVERQHQDQRRVHEEDHDAEGPQRLRLEPAARRDVEHRQQVARDDTEDGEGPQPVEVRLVRPLLDDDRSIDGGRGDLRAIRQAKREIVTQGEPRSIGRARAVKGSAPAAHPDAPPTRRPSDRS